MPDLTQTYLTSICLNCSQPIALCKFIDLAWEPDYDPCNDFAIWRHFNGYAACLSHRIAVPRPKIVVLCGSTRYYHTFDQVNKRLTLDGIIVLTIGCVTSSDSILDITVTQKRMLDELHKRKIDLADEILVLNVDGYIGESTRSEIEYAERQTKVITYLEGDGKEH